MRHLVLVTLYGSLSGMYTKCRINIVISPGDGYIPDSHPYRITSTKCRINVVVSPDDEYIVARNM
jgi:hypothetical protein